MLEDSTWKHSFYQVNPSVRLHYVEAGQKDGVPIVLLHGWPDLWFGWRKQIKVLAPKYRLIVPDMRGFGQSSAPLGAENYSTKCLTSDIAALLDGLNIPKAVVIGHDWGGFIAWRMCLYYPERVIAVCSICTPFNPPHREYISLDTIAEMIPNFAYQKLLADSEKTAARLDTQPARLFSALFRRYNEFKPFHLIALLHGVTDLSIDAIFTNPSTLLSDEERQYYVDQYSKRGFLGGCNYYRVTTVNYETEKASNLPRTIPQPALFIGADRDAVLSPALAKSMSKHIPKLKSVIVHKAGHWILWEKPEEVNQNLLQWLQELEQNKIIPSSSFSTLLSHL